MLNYKGARIATPGPYGTTHEGIFGGLDLHGIPFVIENSKRHGGVVASTLDEFSSGGKWWVIQYAPAGQEDRLVRRALTFRGREYHTTSYNCQDFTSEVYNGVASSWELKQVFGGLVVGALAVAAILSVKDTRQ